MCGGTRLSCCRLRDGHFKRSFSRTKRPLMCERAMKQGRADGPTHASKKFKAMGGKRSLLALTAAPSPYPSLSPHLR